MRKLYTILTFVFLTASLFAQSPQKMSYQAVIRNISNQLVPNHAVGMRISILQGSVTGTPVYVETQTPKTNANGLATIELGGGAGFDAINWANSTYFIKTETDPLGGTDYTITGISQLLSVPYAFFASKVGNGFSGSYNDLTNKPELFNGTWSSLTGKPTLATVASSGSYNDLTNLPTLTNGTVTSVTGTSPILVATGTTTPEISMVKANGTTNGYLSSADWTTFNNKSSFDGTWSSLTGKPTGNSTGDLQYWNGTTWVLLPRGSSGQVLTISSSNIPSWQNSSAPSAIALDASNILVNTATLSGNVNANGFSSNITFEYGTATSYGNTLIAIQSPVTGYVTTNVNATVNSLSANTTYHVRLKTENAIGVSYSNDISFTTSGLSPTASTLASTSITTSSSNLNGIINANGFSTVVSFEYGTTTSYGISATPSQSPVTGNSNINVNANISGLVAGSTYHYRVKAVNSIGTTYGSDMSFMTAPTTVNDVDGNTYNVIAIGNQIWMAENLKTIKFNDGTAISLVSDNTAWGVLSTPGCCWYNNDAATNKATYGALYNWYTLDATSNSGKNVCPTDWHVPSDVEWKTLTTYLGGESISGGKLKETGTTHWISPNTGATNETGFKALPGGYRYYDGTFFTYIGNYGIWWSSTQYSTADAWFREMVSDNSSVYRDYNKMRSGFSVRCLRDF